MLRADLHNILGETYHALGLMEEAEHHHRTSLSLREELFSAPNPEIAEALYYLASVMKTSDPQQRIEFLWRAIDMQRQVNEGNNFPFMVQEVAWYLRLGGAPDVARNLLSEAAAFVDTSFVDGRESFRYRDYVSTMVAMSMVELEVANGDAEQANIWFARGDSLIAQIPEQAQPSSWRDLLLQLEGSKHRVDGKYREAEELLLTAYSNASDEQSPSEHFIHRIDWVGYHLSLLYRDWGRPYQASRYRTHVDVVDSVTALLTASVGEIDFGELSDRPHASSTIR